MRGSLKLFRLFGIPLFIHWTFLILLAWIFGSALYRGQDFASAAQSAAYVLAIFGCVVLHELGHALAARQYGIGTRDITLLPIGGVARLERMPEKPAREIVVALAGPLVNVVIAAVLWAVVGLRDMTGLSAAQVVQADGDDWLFSLMVVNISLVLFNMIPAFPMDGGRVLRAVLALFMERGVATRVAATVGQVCAMGFVLLGLFGNPLLILVGVFVWLGAQAEARQAESRAYLSGVPVREAMITEFKVLRANDTLDAALQELLQGNQPDFPVVDERRVVGVLPRSELLRGVAERGTATLVREVMRRDCTTAEEGEPLERVVERMRETGCPLVPVLRRGELVGLLTVEQMAKG